MSIFQQSFERIVLDEAHVIRNVKSKTFRACLNLQAPHRWCLTGTPLPNKPADVQALLHFVRLEPLDDAAVFRRSITQSIHDDNDDNGGSSGLALLRNALAHVALRRNKATANIKLPPKQVQLVTVEMNVSGSSSSSSSTDPHVQTYQCSK